MPINIICALTIITFTFQDSKVVLAHPTASSGVFSRRSSLYNGNYSNSSISICLYASFVFIPKQAVEYSTEIKIAG
jgi:hypothetical protein